MTLDSRTPIFIPGDSRIHNTAAREFAFILGIDSEKDINIIKYGDPLPHSVFIGLLDDSQCIRQLIISGILSIHNTNSELDAFEIVFYKKVLYLLGNTARGMLQAVYEFQEYNKLNLKLPRSLHLKGTFHLSMRIFHQRFSPWPGEISDFRYISHIGATHCLICHDWNQSRNFQMYVESNIFPNAINADIRKNNYDSLKSIITYCEEYALNPCMWITELPCQGGPWVPDNIRADFLNKYPAEVLSDSGTYEGKVLCFSHPLVQEYYRDLMKTFFTEFPEISVLFLFGMDSGGEFCCPDSCPRCKGMSRFEQRDRLIKFFVDEGRKIRPGLKVLTTSWYWGQVDMAEFISRQSSLPKESGLYMAAQKDGWEVERQCHEFLEKAKKACSDKGQIFIGYDDFLWGDDSLHNMNDIQDFPLGIGAKIRRWYELGADGVFDHWGGTNENIPCNSIACREFFINPLSNPVDVAEKIALRQFGADIGKYVLKSWVNLDTAHRILSNFCIWQPGQWPMWYDGMRCYPDIQGMKKFLLLYENTYLPQCKTNGFVYNEGSLYELFSGVGIAWENASLHFINAACYMNKALDSCDNGELFYSFWWNGRQPSVTKKEHLIKEYIYIKANSLVGREIGIHFQLAALYLGLTLKGAEEKYYMSASKLLKKDLSACLDVVKFMESASSECSFGRNEYKNLYLKKAAFLEKLQKSRL